MNQPQRADGASGQSFCDSQLLADPQPQNVPLNTGVAAKQARQVPSPATAQPDKARTTDRLPRTDHGQAGSEASPRHLARVGSRDGTAQQPSTLRSVTTISSAEWAEFDDLHAEGVVGAAGEGLGRIPSSEWRPLDDFHGPESGLREDQALCEEVSFASNQSMGLESILGAAEECGVHELKAREASGVGGAVPSLSEGLVAAVHR